MSSNLDPNNGAGASGDSSLVAGTESRRRVLKGLGAGSPLLLTIVSGPVQATQCVMPSGYISAATFASRHPGGSVCTMNGPSYFLNTNRWPTSDPNPVTSKFKAIFGAEPDLAGSNQKNDTLPQVLAGGYTSDFTKFCIAAYLNARLVPPGWPALTASMVVELWYSFKVSNSLPVWVPSTWTVTDAEAWLRILMAP